jgi:hypothetical protein
MKRLNLLTSLYSLKSVALVTLLTVGTISASWAGSNKQALAITKSIIEKSGITAQHTIKQVQQDYNGIIYSYELDDEEGVYYHEVKLIDIEADKKIKLTISIQDGSIVNEEQSRLFSWFSEDDRIVTAKKLAKMDYSMLNAIDAINLDFSSLLTEIEVEDKQGILFFELETISPKGKKDWLVDVNNNQLIPVFKK